MRTRMITLVSIATLALSAAGGPVTAQDAEPPADDTARELGDLFGPAEMLRGALELNEAVVAFEPVTVNRDLLRDAGATAKLTLNVRPNLAYTARVQSTTQRGPQTWIVKGVLEGIPDSSFTFVSNEAVTVGIIRTDDPNTAYRLRYTPEGAHVLLQLDISRYPIEACCTPAGQAFISQGPQPRKQPFVTSPSELAQRLNRPGIAPPEHPDQLAPAHNDQPADHSRGSCPDVPDVIDVLICYTTNALAAMGGTAAAEAQALLAVEVSNDCYQNSGVNFRMRLVHVMPAGYTEASGSDQEDWLGWITNQSVAADVHAARDLYGADFISMFTAGGSGIGWCSSSELTAMSTCKWSRAVDTWTLAHEIGHNQGLAHNREDNDSCNSSSYSFGWWYVGNSGSTWGTVMAYPGMRIPYFSNPNVFYDGQPTGVPRGQNDESDNVYALNQRIVIFEPFRLTRYDVWLDFYYFNPFGFYFGSNLNPYRSIVEAIDAINNGNSASELPNLWVKPSAVDVSITIDKPMLIRACGGDVYIGQVP